MLLSRMSLYHTRLQEPLYVFAYNVCLQVYRVSNPEYPEVSVGAGLGQYRDRERIGPDRDDGQAYTVHADAPLLDAVAEHRLGRPKLPDLRLALGPHAEHLTDTVDVPLHDMAPEPVSRGHRPLQVDGASLAQGTERGTPEGLRHGEEGERPAVNLSHRQARSVYGDAISCTRIRRDPVGRDVQAQHLATLHPREQPNFLNKPGEHVPPLPRRRDRASRRRPFRPSRPQRPRTEATRPL